MQRLRENVDNITAGLESAQLKRTADEMEKKGLVLLAWDYGRPTPGEEPTSISVREVKEAEARTLEDAAQREKEELGGDILSQPVSLPIGDAMLVKSKYRNRIGDDVCDIRYLLLDEGSEYVLRLVATNAASNIEPFADDVAKSLRIQPKAG